VLDRALLTDLDRLGKTGMSWCEVEEKSRLDQVDLPAVPLDAKAFAKQAFVNLIQNVMTRWVDSGGGTLRVTAA